MNRRSLHVGLLAVCATLVFTASVSAMYHPTLGRFAQRDPKGYVDGMSLYEYVRSSPLTKVDPDGTEFHVVEAEQNESKDKPQYTPKTKDVKKPDGTIEKVPIVKDYVDKVKEMAKAVKEIPEEDFTARQKAGEVVWDGKPFEGARQDYLDKLGRELNSSWEVQNSGGADSLRKKADELKAKNTQPEDSTGIGVHAAPQAKNVYINDEKVPRDPTMKELGERKGAKGEVLTGNCYREKDVKEAFSFVGEGKVVTQEGELKSITFTPARLRRVEEKKEP